MAWPCSSFSASSLRSMAVCAAARGEGTVPPDLLAARETWQYAAAILNARDPMLARVYARSLRHLDEDLRILDCAAAIALTPDIAGRHRYWGHRYVIDGSSMGARVLVRDVAALG